MKARLLTALLFPLTLAGLRAQADHLHCKATESLIAMEQAAADGRLHFRASPETGDYDIKYHRMEWAVNPNNYYISGQVTTHFVPTAPDFASLHFDLADELVVSSILYRGQEILGFDQAGNLLAIPLPAPIASGQLDSITVVYEGAPPSNGFGSFTQSMHAGEAVLWTLSEPYGARDWWPCKQDLNDKIDSLDIYVRTPAAYKVASNGLLVSVAEDEQDHIYHWRHRYPITAYLVALAVTNYAEYSDFVPVPGGPPIEVLNYVFPENLASAQQATPATVAIMELFNELFGLYPFADEKYGHAQFGWGGGMEHQTMSFMGGFSHLLQAHELAHQWFGNKVTCGSWQDIWLNEGFATYLEGLTYEHSLGPNTWPNWLQGKINHVTSEPDGAVFVIDTSSVSRIFSSRLSYSKGAMVLHTLRWVMGDDAFFAALRNYLNAPELAFGYARTDDLKRYLEATAGQDLGYLFDDWVYGQGYPSYQVHWFQENGQVHVKLGQTTSHPSVSFFELPVPIRFASAGGADTLVVFTHAYDGQQFSFAWTQPIAQVQFDPELRIVSKDNTIVQTVFTSSSQPTLLDMEVFPNPASGQFNFVLPEGFTVGTLSVIDPSGQAVLRRAISRAAFSGSVDLSGLPSGVYFLELRPAPGSAAVSYRQRVVKMD